MNCNDDDKPSRVRSTRVRSMSFHCPFRQFSRTKYRRNDRCERSSRSRSCRRATFRHFSREGPSTCSRGNRGSQRRSHNSRTSSVVRCLFRVFLVSQFIGMCPSIFSNGLLSTFQQLFCNCPREDLGFLYRIFRANIPLFRKSSTYFTPSTSPMVDPHKIQLVHSSTRGVSRNPTILFPFVKNRPLKDNIERELKRSRSRVSSAIIPIQVIN